MSLVDVAPSRDLSWCWWSRWSCCTVKDEKHFDVTKDVVSALNCECAEKADDRAFTGLRARLEVEDKDVRESAVLSLAELAEKGDIRAMNVLCDCVDEEAAADVTNLAVEALDRFAEKGDDRPVKILCARLHDADNVELKRAMWALRVLAEKGDDRVISALCACLENADKSNIRNVRSEALLALRELSEKGDKFVITVLCACLEDAIQDVRLSAVLALLEVADKDDERVVTGLFARLMQDADMTVMSLALEAIRKLAEKGDEQAIGILWTRLEDANKPVRRQAARTLGVLAEMGDERVITDLCARLCEDTDIDVISLAVEAFNKLAEKGDGQASRMFWSHLGQANKDASTQAVQALQVLVERCDEKVITSLCDHFDQDAEIHVVSLAAEAFNTLAEKGHERVTKNLWARLEDPNKAVRKQARWALEQFKLAEKLGISQAISALENNSATAILLDRGSSLDVHFQPFVSSLQRNTSVIAMDLTSLEISSHHVAEQIVAALETNVTLTALKLPDRWHRVFSERIKAALHKNEVGVQVVICDISYQSPGDLMIVCSLFSGAEVAIMHLDPTDSLQALVAEVNRMTPFAGHRAFVHKSGDLICGPLERPAFQVNELLQADLLTQAEGSGDGNAKREAAEALAKSTVNRITRIVLARHVEAQDAHGDLKVHYSKLEDPDFSVRVRAVERLAKHAAAESNKQATEAILRRLKDDHYKVRSAALWAVVSSQALTTVQAKQVILEMAGTEENTHVLHEMRDAVTFLAAQEDDQEYEGEDQEGEKPERRERQRPSLLGRISHFFNTDLTWSASLGTLT